MGPDGGDVRSLSFDPKNPDHILLGTSSGELFASHDRGATWSGRGVITHPRCRRHGVTAWVELHSFRLDLGFLGMPNRLRISAAGSVGAPV